MTDRAPRGRVRPADEVRRLLLELRKPLGIIAGYAALIENGTIAGPPGTVEGAVAVIGCQASKALRIVESVQGSQGGLALPYRPRPVDLCAAVAGAVARIEPRARRQEASIDVEIPSSRLSVRADPEDLRRILDLLLENVLQHCPTPARARLEVRPGDPAEVVISDQGPGIPPEVQLWIFEPPGPGADPGPPHRGMALALGRRLAERNGGELILASSTGAEGSTFVLRWPRTSMGVRVADDAEIDEPLPDPARGG